MDGKRGGGCLFPPQVSCGHCAALPSSHRMALSSAVPSASCCSSLGAGLILLQSTPPQSSSKVHSAHCESPSHPAGTLTWTGVAKVQEDGPLHWA